MIPWKKKKLRPSTSSDANYPGHCSHATAYMQCAASLCRSYGPIRQRGRPRLASVVLAMSVGGVVYVVDATGAAGAGGGGRIRH